jgi:hypothetical protein
MEERLLVFQSILALFTFIMEVSVLQLILIAELIQLAGQLIK